MPERRAQSEAGAARRPQSETGTITDVRGETPAFTDARNLRRAPGTPAFTDAHNLRRAQSQTCAERRPQGASLHFGVRRGFRFWQNVGYSLM